MIMHNITKHLESNFFKTGNKISSFNERDINGNKFNLKELAGKIVVLNFWFINCPPCRLEMPELNALTDKYRDNKEVVFIAIALDEKYDINEFLKTNPFRYNIIDNGRYLASRYGINSFPTNLVLDKQGKVLFHSSGYARNMVSWLEKSIEAGLKETALQ
jgi:thiol-disulfide isomerase/thioredoxin